MPDFFTRIAEGEFYGWPYSYTGSHPQPGFAERAPEGLIESAKVGEVLFEGHSAAMDFVFYTGTDFPEDYHGDAFVALKGSWNRADPTGYKVVRVPFENGEPADGSYENFLTGFWVSGDDRAEIWGRPADVAMSADGSLLVADDTGGTIWKVRYVGGEEPEVPTPVSDEAQTEGSDGTAPETPNAELMRRPEAETSPPPRSVGHAPISPARSRRSGSGAKAAGASRTVPSAKVAGRSAMRPCRGIGAWGATEKGRTRRPFEQASMRARLRLAPGGRRGRSTFA